MNNDKFIIFLDVDGVLCSYDNMCHYEDDGEHSFVSESINALNTISTYYDADLCIISSWNSKFHTEEQWSQFLVSRGIIVNNLTFGDNHNRSRFIKEKIKEGLKYYLIIDDEAHEYYRSIPEIEYKRILQPNRYRCLDMYDVKNVTVNWKLNV